MTAIAAMASLIDAVLARGEAMRRFRIGDDIVEEGAASFGTLLAECHARRLRPLCLCREAGVEMYVAHVEGRPVVKRMPLSGSAHDPACPSYEPPYELSGRGHVLGSAIQEDAEQGLTSLKFGFSLSRTGARGSATGLSASEPASARASQARLSLRGLLHFLWDEAEFTHWTSGMAGRRNWAVVRAHLLRAAAQKMAKGVAIAEILFVPEVFALERAAAIDARRGAAIGRIQTQDGSTRRFMILIGEVKEIQPARGGHRLVIRHLPKYPFLLSEGLYQRLQARFSDEFELLAAVEGSRLVAIATFSVGPTGVATVEEMAVMTVTENWIPFESLQELQLTRALQLHRERSIKGLRYNLPASEPIAAMFLPNTRPKPVAMYIIPPGADQDYRRKLEELIAKSDLATWIWDVSNGEMPDVPPLDRQAQT